MYEFDLVRLVAGAAFLGAAAVTDLRTRTVKDALWLAMGTVGLVLFGLDLWLQGADAVVALVLVPTAVLMYDPLIGQGFRTEEGWRFPPGPIVAYALAIGATGFAIWDLRGDPTSFEMFVSYLTVPVMMLVYRGMYEAHLFKGGADAKAMIVISAFVPQYPFLPPLPLLAVNPTLQQFLGLLFPFSLVVLLDAALLFAVAPIGFLVYNAARGHLEFPMALLGYKVPLDHVPRYVWFMDQVVKGEHVMVYFPAKRQDRVAILAGLRKEGLKEAWVTPQLPFMVALFVGYVLAFLVGNPLIALLQSAMPLR